MSITVKSQAELDRIPLDTDEQIYIEFGSYFTPAIVRNKYRYSVVAWENSSVLRCFSRCGNKQHQQQGRNN